MIVPFIIFITSKDLDLINLFFNFFGIISTLIYISIIFYQNWVIKSNLNIKYEDNKFFQMIDKNDDFIILRVQVENTGKRTLHNCEAKAQIYQKTRNSEKIMEEDVAILHWSRRIITSETQVDVEKDFKPITINRGDKEFLDVLKVYSTNFFLYSDRYLSQIGTEYPLGTYYIELTVYSEDLFNPCSRKFIFEKKEGKENYNFKEA